MAERERLLLVLERETRADERAQAASELCELAAISADKSFAADIPRLLADKQIEVQRCALALAAFVLPQKEALTLLAARLSDPRPEIRTEAAGRLADLGSPEIRAILAPVLTDPVFAVRFEAARAMASLQHPSGLEVLVEALDRDEYRFRALGALGELGDKAALPHIQRVFKKWLLPAFERTQAAGVLARLGDPKGAEHLARVARGRWTTDRSLALELCGEVKVPGAFELLETLVRDAKDSCRGAAARGLGRLGDPRGVSPLRALLAESQAPEDFRLDAAEGLYLLGAREDVKRALPAFSPEGRRELELMLAP